MSEWIEKGRDYIKYSDVMILTHWSVSISQHKLCLSLNTTVVSLNERNCSVKGSVCQLIKKIYKDFKSAITAEDTWMALNWYLVEQSQRRLIRMTTRHWQICETQPMFM